MRFLPVLALFVVAACGAPSGPSPSERDGYLRCPSNPGSFYKPGAEWTCEND